MTVSEKHRLVLLSFLLEIELIFLQLLLWFWWIKKDQNLWGHCRHYNTIEVTHFWLFIYNYSENQKKSGQITVELYDKYLQIVFSSIKRTRN